MSEMLVRGRPKHVGLCEVQASREELNRTEEWKGKEKEREEANMEGEEPCVAVCMAVGRVLGGEQERVGVCIKGHVLG